MPPRSSPTAPPPRAAQRPPASDEAPQAEAALNKAAQLELSGSYDDAFRLYVTAAQSFLHLSRSSFSSSSSPTPSAPNSPSDAATKAADQARYKSLAKRALDRAEKIKAHKKDVRPVARERLGKAAQAAVLDRSAVIGGRRYPLWSTSGLSLPGGPAAESEPGLNGAEVFEDPDGLPSLSAVQRSALAGWHKPDIPLHSPDLGPSDLIQETITDCSVVAALAVCVSHNTRFNARLGLSSLYPQNADGLPICAPSGRYDVLLHLNGAERRVTIDDRLPMRANGCLLCVSTKGRKALWPSLLEKAYLKVMGGYDFGGSNGSIDLHAITGWIPEHIRIVDAKFQREKAWRRLHKAFNAGTCLMTVGTGRSPGVFGEHKLTPFHAYAVIGLEEKGAERTVSLWNPWGRRRDEAGRKVYSEGLIQMEWDDLCGIFDSIYLNWDPGIFAHKAVIHSLWQPNRAQADREAWTSNHQYNVIFSGATAGDTEIWVLLSRHITGKEDEETFIAGHVFHVAEADSATVRPALEATYTDSPHVLVRTSRLPDENALSVITSRHGIGSDTAYTLSVFSHIAFALTEPTHVYSFSQWVNGTFTASTAGGNALHTTFMRNPQYALIVKPDLSGSIAPNGAQIRVSVHGSKDLPLHVQIVWGRGERVFDVRQTKIIKDSGTYNYGFGMCEAQARAGTYTVIVSSFEPGVVGEFKLHMECSQPFELKPIPQEGAGMFSKRLQGRWHVGAPSSPYELVLDKPTVLSARLQLIPPASLTPIKLLLEAISSSDTRTTEVASSGQFTDTVAGAAFHDVRLSAGRYRLVASIVSAHVDADFVIQVYSSACAIKSKQL